jgi:hypothetical protein
LRHQHIGDRGTTLFSDGKGPRMKMARFTRSMVVDETQLERAGFTREQITRLSELRESYLLLEYIELRRQRQWLTFMKWCYVTGRISA